MQDTENKNKNTALSPSDFPTIEGLEILELLGKGGMSTVYKARQISLDRLVAVKVLSLQALGEAGMQRFKNEAKNSANLNHPNVIKVLSAGISTAGAVYIVMEYLDGKSLADILKEQPPKVSRAQLGKLLCNLLSGLDYAHKCGFIHRDLKPANIMIVTTPTGLVPKIVDFGIAKSLASESQKLTTTGTIIGTPAYMSPEQCLNRDLDLRSDLYSMACIIYECFTGRQPYYGDNSLELMYKHINAPAPAAESLKKSCGEALGNLISETMSKNPEDRPSSASRMRDILDRALSTVPETFVPEKMEKPIKADKIVRAAAPNVEPSRVDPFAKSSDGAKKSEASKPAEGQKKTDGTQKPEFASSRSLGSEDLEKKSPAKAIAIVLGILIFLLLILKDSILPFFVPMKPPQVETQTEKKSVP